MDKKNVWFITAKTNLHVGNENASTYGLIDLAVQRNATTGLPCINSSSLKGALNEYASHKELTSQQRIEIFGSDKTGEDNNTKKGKYTFFDADILFLPVQDDSKLYHLETSKAVLKQFKDKLSMLGIKIDDNVLKEELQRLGVIDECHLKWLDDNDDNNARFIELCSDDSLPIIARNVLENGESKNLWYEQVIPAETVFYTIIDDNEACIKKSKEDQKCEKRVLETLIIKKDALIQIGANATIGYGYCKFTCLENASNNEQSKKQ